MTLLEYILDNNTIADIDIKDMTELDEQERTLKKQVLLKKIKKV